MNRTRSLICYRKSQRAVLRPSGYSPSLRLPTWGVNPLSQRWGLHLNNPPSSFGLVSVFPLAVRDTHTHCRPTGSFTWAPPEWTEVFPCRPIPQGRKRLCTRLPCTTLGAGDAVLHAIRLLAPRWTTGSPRSLSQTDTWGSECMHICLCVGVCFYFTASSTTL